MHRRHERGCEIIMKQNDQIVRTYDGEGNLKGIQIIPTRYPQTEMYRFAGIAAIIVISIIAIMGVGAFLFAPHSTPPTVIVTTPAPTPTPAPLETTNVLTVTLMTTSGGFPQIGVQEDDRCFWLSYNDYDNIRLGDRVRFTINGKHNLYNNVQYNVVSVNIISHRYDRYYNNYPRYYHYQGRYYQYDGHTVDPMTWKQIRGEEIIEGMPPYY